MFNQIKSIANDNPDGFTIYLPSLEFVKHGWVIANKLTQNQFGDEGLQVVLEFAMQHNRIVGGYRNADGIFQWDASIVEPVEETAIQLMKLHDQDSIYHLDTQTLIWNDRK